MKLLLLIIWPVRLMRLFLCSIVQRSKGTESGHGSQGRSSNRPIKSCM